MRHTTYSTSGNKKQSAFSSTAKKPLHDTPALSFLNTSPQAVVQTKMQQLANTAGVVKQLKAYQDMANTYHKHSKAVQLQAATSPTTEQFLVQRKENRTGLPDTLKSGIEQLSGYTMDDVKVHYNSAKPAQLQAHAYAQGTDIHLAAGQEKHLPHEAWHVVQQKQGRVKPTLQLKETIGVNDDAVLEREADVMGRQAAQLRQKNNSHTQLASLQNSPLFANAPIQRVIGPDMPRGSKVLDTRTKHIYIIIGYDAEKGYKLIHSAIASEHPRFVLPNNENYNFFAGPEVAPKKSGGLFSMLGGGAKEPPTVSGSYEKARKTEIAERWPKIKPEVQAIKTQALELEKAKPGSVAFYNAAGLGAHTLHRVIMAIYEVVHGMNVHNHVFFRAPGNPPRPEASQDPQTFLATRSTSGTWSDHKETDSMVSANISLSANVADGAESTFDILQTGGLFDMDAKKIVTIVGKMLESMHITDDHARIILQEVHDLARIIEKIKTENQHSGKRESVLYQTFIPKGLIPKLVYIAQTNGHPLDYHMSMVEPDKVLAGIAAAGKELKNGEMFSFGATHAAQLEKMGAEDKEKLFHSSKFTHYVLEAAKAPSFWAAMGHLRDPQARILMHPKVFAEPSGLAETVTHNNLSRKTSGTLDEGMRRIKGATLKVQLIKRIEDQFAIDGTVFARFGKLAPRLPEMDIPELRHLLERTSAMLRENEALVQHEVWDFIGAHPQIKEAIEAGLKVVCRGKSVPFDIDVPARMLPDELHTLIALLHELSTTSQGGGSSGKKVEEVNLLDL
ncbi:DUF4157 domain-containing protein [Ascidiimonas aurantiaca]|uniref:eCIS core domain-containing protein n=1 Tax=Ascidiimonas aurantiaca TaxID=1685432 RepID=UPI0030EEDE0C